MLNIFIFISIALLFTYIIGRLIEKAHVPWIFAALIFGTVLAFYNPFTAVTESAPFGFLAQLGMFFLLFIVGMEIDLNEIKRQSGFIVRSALFIIGLEALAGSLLIHFVFGYAWPIAVLVALSFATVGEAILVPILDRFGLMKTRLGQTIIGIGAADDMIEIIALILISVFIGHNSSRETAVSLALLFVLFGLTAYLSRLRKQGRRFRFAKLETLLLLALAVLMLFVGIGELAHAAPLAALLAGISLTTFLPKLRLKLIDKDIKVISYALFTPMFFIQIGAEMDASYLVSYPLLVLLVVVVSKGMKLLGSYLVANKRMGKRESILMGIALSVRFSTSIIIIKILFDNGVVGAEIYSVIVASSIIFKFIIPVLFSNLLARWKIAQRTA